MPNECGQFQFSVWTGEDRYILWKAVAISEKKIVTRMRDTNEIIKPRAAMHGNDLVVLFKYVIQIVVYVSNLCC